MLPTFRISKSALVCHKECLCGLLLRGASNDGWRLRPLSTLHGGERKRWELIQGEEFCIPKVVVIMGWKYVATLMDIVWLHRMVDGPTNLPANVSLHEYLLVKMFHPVRFSWTAKFQKSYPICCHMFPCDRNISFPQEYSVYTISYIIVNICMYIYVCALHTIRKIYSVYSVYFNILYCRKVGLLRSRANHCWVTRIPGACAPTRWFAMASAVQCHVMLQRHPYMWGAIPNVCIGGLVDCWREPLVETQRNIEPFAVASPYPRLKICFDWFIFPVNSPKATEQRPTQDATPRAVIERTLNSFPSYTTHLNFSTHLNAAAAAANECETKHICGHCQTVKYNKL